MRIECLQAVELVKEHFPEIQSLRDVTVAMLDTCVLQKNKLVYQRSRFVVDEMKRLLQACEFLQEGNIAALGKRMYQTHEGLSKHYEVSCKELDYLVDFVKDRSEVIGARMMGGGFGGCTINLVKKEKADSLISMVNEKYSGRFGQVLKTYVVSIDNGTSLV